MATYDNSYSRVIALTKTVLPIVALAILATLFLFSRKIDPNSAIPYAEVDVAELAREQRIGAPNYAGVTDDGSAISVTARAARPDSTGGSGVTATALSAVIEKISGGRIEVVSDAGTIDTARQTSSLTGNVVVKTSTGYTIRTTGITLALDRTDIKTTGPVVADGPPGVINAGLMELYQEGGAQDRHVLVFKNRVKLVYIPATTPPKD
jgi:lipopolysaccharide export system protein LptC